jgi:superfamily II DNA or RNA helicase
MSALIRPLRKWQETALDAWHGADRRGIIGVVTGGGKTFFALKCIDEYQRSVPGATALITVPTEALVDQWFEEAISFFDMPPKFINLVTRGKGIIPGRMNIAVINTAAKVVSADGPDVFLVVDECHRAASPVFRRIFEIPHSASLGLSATPERQYDDWFAEVLVPNLGPIIYTYSYHEAMRDGVIVPFALKNVVFEFTAEEQKEYDRLTAAIRRTIGKFGPESDQAIQLLLKRARSSNASPTRVRIALKLIAKYRSRRILVFHENIDAANFLFSVLKENRVAAGIYHSKIPLLERVRTLTAYRAGRITVLVTCRALDEGFNVPETEIAIIAASTASYRQRVQRLGRALRPAQGKAQAVVYSIVASPPEIRRLADEAEDLAEVASVSWSRM